MGNYEKLKKFEVDLFSFLLQGYPAAVTSANAARLAKLIAPKAGPYTIVSGDVLNWLSEGTSKAAHLTAGSRTAAQIAATINALSSPGVTASADSAGRLVLTSDTAPVAGQHSEVQIVESSVGTPHTTLGWWAGAKDTRAVIETPRFTSGPGQHRKMPEVELAALAFEPDAPIQSGMATLFARLIVRDFDRQGDHQATYDLVRHQMSIIDDLIDTDPSGGGAFSKIEVTRMEADPDVWELDIGGDFNHLVAFGEGVLEIEARVYNY